MSSQRHLTQAGGLLTAVLLAGALAGCGKSNSYRAPPPPPVVTSKPVMMEMTDYLSVTGTTASVNSVQLVARVAGYLSNIDYKDGTIVKQNQPLFVIEQAPYQIRVNQAQAAVAKAKAQVVYAQAQYDRQTEMIAQNATSKADVEQALATRDVDQAQVLQALADLQDAQLDYGYTIVAAPFDGRVGRHHVDIGNLVGAGSATNLATIDQLSPIYVYFNINELDALKIREFIRSAGSDPYNVTGVPIFVGLQSETDFPHQGKLDYVATGLDPSTGTVEARAVLDNRDDILVPGLFVRAQIPIGAAKQRMALPDAAIQSDQAGSYVLVIDSKNIVAQKRVATGVSQNGMTAVTGLDPNQQVIVDGLQNAATGSPVAPSEQDITPPPSSPDGPG